MSVKESVGGWLRPLIYLGRNPISLTGAVLTTSSALTVISFWLFEIVLGGGASRYPYAGIVFYLFLPTLFLLGLILMPAGALWRRHQLLRRGELPTLYPRVDFAEPLLRRAVALILFATFINVVIFTAASYKGVQYMDSVAFCGTTCHTVMQPEYTAYLNSPHSRVACVECHIGPGASWFVRSKLSGTKQVFAVLFNTYPRPIPSPVTSLRPARATCEQCHWPQRFEGNVLLVLNHFDSDQANTEETTVLVMKVGGQNASGPQGIHGHHLAPGTKITYIALDRERQVIPEVSYTDASGKTTVFRSTAIKATPQQLAEGQHRTMDCMDCHNRPTHTFQLPGDALDQDMSEHYISTDLPYIKKEALAALKTTYPSRLVARQRIAQTLENFYKTQYPQVVATKNAQLQEAIRSVQQIYLRNVFPQMHVTWGTYIDDLGHTNWPGCFRCHDGSHVAANGQSIPNDCSTCHDILAMSEHNPKVLSQLGMP
ncbi:MAG TPA: NapC/NirT family cytochrome c [Candidatus Dormibacteraeota bacterium]|nr:NapC/NirT family cytochrome c [Candidatus Dormibacteraeota bacterium]